MFRSSRSIAILIRHLMVGTAATVATATVATALVSCQDESQPQYWVKKAEDPKWRPKAIKRLEQFYQDALTRAGNDPTKPEVQELLNVIVEPLTRAYLDGYDNLDTKTRVSLIKLIASFRDKRTEPALKKALEGFVAKPTGKREEEDIKWAIRAQSDLQLPALQPLILQVFQKLETSSMLGGITYKDLNECMLQHPEKEWAEPLKKMLEAEIKPPEKKKPETVEAYRNQLFWQTVSAQVLGELREPTAVEPLIKVILDPYKGDVATTALLALVKIGKPASDRAMKVLRSEDKELVDFHLQKLAKATAKDGEPKADDVEKLAKEKPHVPMAAIMLGMIGQRGAIDPMIKTMKEMEEKNNKAVILSELTKIPATDASKAAFKEGFEQLDMDVRLPPRGGKALPDLTSDAVTRFYDPSMLDWLIERGEQTKGYGDDLKDFRATILVTMFKLAKPDQIGKLDEYLTKWGTKNTDKKSKNKYFESSMHDLSVEVLKACGDKVPCYLTTMESSDAQSKDNQFKGIKCAYMATIYGDEKTAMQIVERLQSIENAAVRFAASQAIDHLLPNGSLEVADELEKIIEANKKTADSDRIAGDAPLKQVLYRIRSRAQK